MSIFAAALAACLHCHAPVAPVATAHGVAPIQVAFRSDEDAGSTSAANWGAAITSGLVGRVTLLVAVQKTGAPRSTDTIDAVRQAKLESMPLLVQMRTREDANFVNRTKKLAERIAKAPAFTGPPELAEAMTGAGFLDALVAASRYGEIGNLVIYGHSGPDGLYMLEDRGFYSSVGAIAGKSVVADGDGDEKEQRLRSWGARDLGDLEALIQNGDIRFAKDAAIVLTGCSAAGEFSVETSGIAARLAALVGGKVVASVGSTDQSMSGMTHGLPIYDYSRNTWVRFTADDAPRKLRSHVLDSLKQLTGDTPAEAADSAPTSRDTFIPDTPFRCAASGPRSHGSACVPGKYPLG